MLNSGIMKFKRVEGKYGNLVPIEGGRDIPFDIKRIYYITDVESDIARGFHSHRMLHQVLLCLNGEVKIKLKTPFEEEVIQLKNDSRGLYIGPMIWREMYDFSENAVLLVLASDNYSEDDYIRNYDFYLDEANKLL